MFPAWDPMGSLIRQESVSFNFKKQVAQLFLDTVAIVEGFID